MREIQEAFPEPRPAYTTIQTTIYRLESKGALRCVKRISNANIFDASITRGEAQSTLIDELLSLFGGRTKPVMANFDCRMIGVFHTTRQPMRGFVDKLMAMEGKDGVLSLSIAHGFPWSDIQEMSSRIIAITDNDRPTVQFTSASQSAPESVGTMTITAQLSAPTNVAVTVPRPPAPLGS